MAITMKTEGAIVARVAGDGDEGGLPFPLGVEQ